MRDGIRSTVFLLFYERGIIFFYPSMKILCKIKDEVYSIMMFEI
jgi:hypothetical protein